jgi:hypothetical protein
VNTVMHIDVQFSGCCECMEEECVASKMFGHRYTVVPPYARVIHCKTYRVYVKSRIIPNSIYDAMFM